MPRVARVFSGRLKRGPLRQCDLDGRPSGGIPKGKRRKRVSAEGAELLRHVVPACETQHQGRVA